MKRLDAHYARNRRVRVPGLPAYTGVVAAFGTVHGRTRGRGYMLIACDDGENREIAATYVRFVDDPGVTSSRIDDANSTPWYEPFTTAPVLRRLCDIARNETETS